MAKTVVIFGEDGYWDSSPDRNPDNDLWIKTGYRVRTYEGHLLVKSKERAGCVDWLRNNNFTACPDGEHYEREDSTPIDGRYAFNGQEFSFEAFDDEKFERGE